MAHAPKGGEIVAASARLQFRFETTATSVSVAHGNVASNHVRKLAFDVDRIRNGIERDSGMAAMFALSDVLSTVYRLELERRRGRWSLDKWDDADKESWEALVVARHAADHTDGHIAVTESGHSVRFMWPESISKRETKLRALYERRLGSNEVLPSLERVLALVQAEVK